MEYINIITQEEITTYTQWPAHIVAGAAIIFCFIGLLTLGNTFESCQRCFRWLYHAIACLPLMLFTFALCSIFLQHPTGRYEYTATLDPEMTLVEFEEFQQSYDNVYYEDGLWHFTDKEIR